MAYVYWNKDNKSIQFRDPRLILLDVTIYVIYHSVSLN